MVRARYTEEVIEMTPDGISKKCAEEEGRESDAEPRKVRPDRSFI